MYEQVVQGGARLTQVYGCTAWACANHSEWNCPACSCRFAFHSGIDLAAAWGTPLLAVGYGRVLQIGRLGGTCGGLGPYAPAILTGSVVVWYGHCSSSLVRAGDLVRPGQAIARMGSLGCSTGTHTHIEVLPLGASSGCASLNPGPFLTGWPGTAPAPSPTPTPTPTPTPNPSPASSAAPWGLAAAAALLLYAGSK